MVIGGLSTVHLMIYMGNMRHGPSGNKPLGENVNTRRLLIDRVAAGRINANSKSVMEYIEIWLD